MSDPAVFPLSQLQKALPVHPVARGSAGNYNEVRTSDVLGGHMHYRRKVAQSPTELTAEVLHHAPDGAVSMPLCASWKVSGMNAHLVSFLEYGHPQPLDALAVLAAWKHWHAVCAKATREFSEALELRRECELQATEDWFPAILSGSLSRLDREIAAGAPLNARHPQGGGDTGLHVAAAHGHVLAVRRLIAAGADVSLANDYGYTPLHELCLSASEYNEEETAEIAKDLIQAGAAVDALDHERRSPLAAILLDVVRLKVSMEERVASAEVLMRAGANWDAADIDGQTPRNLAAQIPSFPPSLLDFQRIRDEEVALQAAIPAAIPARPPRI